MSLAAPKTPGPSDPAMARRMNRQLVIGALRRQREISRAAVAEETGLTPATVSSIVGELLDEGIAREIGLASSTKTRGRPAMLVQMVESHRYVAGVQIGRWKTRMAIADAIGQVIRVEEVDTLPLDVKGSARALAGQLQRVLGLAGAAKSKLSSIVVALPGTVETRSGRSVDVPALGWGAIDIAGPLTKKLGCPVVVVEDTQAAATGELLDGAARDAKNVLVVNLGEQLSAALVIDGRLHEGATGVAGALGHVRVTDRPLACGCGRTGCLDTVATPDAIVTEHRRRLGKPRRRRTTASRDPFLDVVRAAQNDDEHAAAVLSEAGEGIARALAAAVNLLNPELIVMTGGVEYLPEPIFETIAQRVLDSAHPDAAAALRVVRSEHGMSGWARGAALLALHHAAEDLTDLIAA